MNVFFAGTGWKVMLELLRERDTEGLNYQLRDPAIPLLEQLGEVDILIPSNGRIDAAAFAAAPRLKFVVQPAAGHENIDLSAAKTREIPVCYCPGQNALAMAEMALLLLLACCRNLGQRHARLADCTIGEPLGQQLSGKNVLLIGQGKSAQALTGLLRGFAVNLRPTSSQTSKAELADAMAWAQLVSIHCPLNRQTRGLLAEAEWRAAKPGLVVVNCARGAIVERQALEQALSSGKLGAYGVDTWWSEPWQGDDPLFQHPKVIATPHWGGSTQEAFGRVADIVAGNIRRFLRGEALEYRLV